MKINIIENLKQFVKKLFFKVKPNSYKIDKAPKIKRVEVIERKLNTELLKLHIEQAKLKSRQIIALIRLKKLNLLKNEYKRQLDEKILRDKTISSAIKMVQKRREELQRAYVDMMINQKYNLAVTLNFNPSHFTGNTFNIDAVKNKVNQWWKLYLQYHLGQNYQGRNDISYICVIEHSNTNIHCHFAVKLNKSYITDEIVYDEERLIETLWKLVIPSGSVFVSRIWSTDWYKYMVKEYGFENKIFVSRY